MTNIKRQWRLASRTLGAIVTGLALAAVNFTPNKARSAAKIVTKPDSISKSIVNYAGFACRTNAPSALAFVLTIDLEME
ncbi:MAG TPA: hypothetical protein VIP51_10760 [Eoetvoesiella sp.]